MEKLKEAIANLEKAYAILDEATDRGEDVAKEFDLVADALYGLQEKVGE
ncbi:Uncharacterised protein [Mycobacterium tuberculosis]|nr:hypothetical protein [Mycobacterium tuberculosis]SGO74747.1 Uncharacterised protein [Mycobacterium tuberculosis]